MKKSRKPIPIYIENDGIKREVYRLRIFVDGKLIQAHSLVSYDDAYRELLKHFELPERFKDVLEEWEE